jgi:hypothetical protein
VSKLVFAIALLLIAPALHAQQADTNGNPPPAEPQAATQADPRPAAQPPNSHDDLPASIRPGHPLDPADVDILTGKRDREMEAARQAGAPVVVDPYGGYGYYGGYYRMNGRLGARWELPLLPLTRIRNPFFFSRFGPMGFGRGAFRGGR